ncbi:MAG TPA: stage II sporulation protein M [Candidatus Limnocylindria bacterium]|nr:stage II sporulation protein M [Candidatus Limnocylindria bacterium]
MRSAQPVDRFVADRRARWARLADLVARAAGRVARLEADDVLELGRLYRATTSDLAIARRDFPRDVVTERLNDLVAAAHALVYSEAPTSPRRLRRLVTAEVPATVRANLPFTGAAALLLFGPWLLAYVVSLVAPEVALSSMSEALREHLAERRPGTEIPAGARPIAGPLIILNNVQVSVVAFAGGMTAGLLTAWVLVANGIVLGTTFAVLQQVGGAGYLLEFILGHGALELSAIVLSGGAGLHLAWAILRPGERSRRDALRLASAQALRTVGLVVVVLGVAGLIEANVSPTTAPAAVKAAVGLVTGVFLWGYILAGGRGTPGRLSAT